MTLFLKSILFNMAFFGWTAICSIFFLPVLLFPRRYLLKLARFWSRGVIFMCQQILGLHFKMMGKETLLKKPFIFAVKHQSTWETIMCHSILPDPSIVLKKELLWIPLFGWYLKRLGSIPLFRSKGKGSKDLKYLLKRADEAIERGQSIVIFPEGTRSMPGQKPTYQSGVASLYLHLKIPVVPIVHNAGIFWPRRGFIKHPGKITLEILDPIEPGFSRQEFMGILETTIESRTNELVREGLSYVSKS